MTDHDEILRSRLRCDELEKTVLGLDYLQKSQGRGIGGLRDELRRTQTELRDLAEKVSNMSHTEQIAEAVTFAIRADRKERWSTGQRIATGGFAIILGVPTVVQVIAWISGWFS